MLAGHSIGATSSRRPTHRAPRLRARRGKNSAGCSMASREQGCHSGARPQRSEGREPGIHTPDSWLFASRRPGMTRLLSRRTAACLLAGVAICLASLAQAQEWPQRPVRMIAPYAAGGNSDVLARLTAQRLSEAFGQQFVVENRVGGNGMIATETVAHSSPDGYTLLWAALPPIVIQPALGKVPYDPVKDFAPVSVVATNPFVLVVNKDIAVKSVAEFIAWVRAQPAKTSYAEGGVGSVTHLAMAIFLKRAGLDMINVSYRGN